jgi:hypothetical protein
VSLPPNGAPLLREGAILYARYERRPCHGDTGIGYGDFRRADRKYRTNEEMAGLIARPAMHKPGAKMPTFVGVIAPDDYPALVAYIRFLARLEPGRSGLFTNQH